MGSAIVANEIQTQRNQKRRRDGHVHVEEPAATPLHIGSSETKSNDIVRAVAKREEEAEVERVKAKGGHKSLKKYPVKKDNVIKRATVKPKPIKGPGPPVQNPMVENVITREERIAEMEKQKVLNGRVFDPKILTEFGCKTSSEFSPQATKRGDIKHAGLPKKFLRGEYQLMFEFINKFLVPRTEERTVAFAADLFLMEKFDELEAINLPAIMLEHMHRVMTTKHGIPYGYLLNYVFKHFEMPLGKGVPNTVKQMFSATTILEC
ncbi:hypothetical protein KY290_031055 [Solanum tuberosum]|uniref:Uncharacterized protein n=1 Tax=Solanum tuberosum TaxID=4113 RepID=A0ABQ7U822_SOLTU|nr:hypothetical protein KY290_031055 [Solanum tuberosum]